MSDVDCVCGEWLALKNRISVLAQESITRRKECEVRDARIEALERERDTARQLAGTWRARAWASNPATSPFPWEPEHTGGVDE